MQTQKTLLQHHIEWCEAGWLPNSGLCSTLDIVNDELFNQFRELFTPNDFDKQQLVLEQKSSLYWASGLDVDNEDKSRAYTELRQNIVLLLCAINNEI